MQAAGCGGCPNQQLCASGEAKKEDPGAACLPCPVNRSPVVMGLTAWHIICADIPAITERMAEVKHKILVLSGKGGVGKSTFSSQLAFALAARDYQVCCQRKRVFEW